MSDSNRSFRDWMVREIETVLSQQTSPPPFLIWCDPHDEWRALLRDAGASSGFEVWAPKSFTEADHELLVRDRFFSNERKPRVVWLAVARDDDRNWDRRIMFQKHKVERIGATKPTKLDFRVIAVANQDLGLMIKGVLLTCPLSFLLCFRVQG